MSITTFDSRPLTDPVDGGAVAAFGRELRQKTKRKTENLGCAIFALVVFGIVAVGIALVLWTGLTSLYGDSLWFTIGMITLAVLVVGWLVTVFVSRRRELAERYRIARFAAANGMTYEDRVDAPKLPGLLFQHGAARRASSIVRGDRPRRVEFGNYQYRISYGKASRTYHWGYVAVKLDVPLPNIVLDAVGNNSIGSSLPADLRGNQRLELEGDFNRYFELYCPRGYEQDALYLFTPDIMARFIDNAAEIDVELVDDWMFLYMRRPASTTDPATWAWLFSLVDTLSAKFDQWARWRDERITAASASQAALQGGAAALPVAGPANLLKPPPPGVAPDGRRLKKRGAWITIALVLGSNLALVLWRLHGV